jgi:hypothetical protein
MHVQGAQVASSDALAYWLKDDAPAESFRAATTIAGGEKVERIESLRAR